ncbi:MAG: hypothetical protein HY22_14340 [[Candidatus Thermochlorobacteriaceae] bacterium GBChlB]|nr:MAG: hypothetical protein HY22_14340 [[Candidatus Thermochlorobacteriaceae] bacterium GBChlB]
MHRKDYVMRQIEELARVIARALSLKALKQFDDAKVELHAAGAKLLGLNEAMLNQMSDCDMLHWLGRGKCLDALAAEKCRWLADILDTEADVLEAEGCLDDSFEKRVKAFSLQMECLHIEQTGDGLEKTRRLLTLIEDYELPPHIERKRETFYMVFAERLN